MKKRTTYDVDRNKYVYKLNKLTKIHLKNRNSSSISYNKRPISWELYIQVPSVQYHIYITYNIYYIIII